MGPPDSTDGRARPPTILFVDDEPLVLRSLRRALSLRAPSWSLLFAESGHEAAGILSGTPVDVVVSDMHMPGMDGAALLRHVQERHPDVVRVVLSGHSDAKLVFRSIPVAHQFLTKPFDGALLASSLARALELRELIGSPTLRAVVGADSRLPSAPRTYTSLTELLARDDASLSQVVTLVESDVALSARIAQLASSAFFRAPSSVKTLTGFVRHLGVDVVKTLVLALEIVDMFSVAGARKAGFSIEELQNHSIAVGQLARTLVSGREHTEDALLAGMLHDVGKLVLASRAPVEFVRALSLSRKGTAPGHLAEREVFGTSHAEVGAYLLGIWGLPAAIVEAVAAHHRPEASTARVLDVTAALYVANILARDDRSREAESAPWAVDPAFVARFGGEPALASWQKAAHERLGVTGE